MAETLVAVIEDSSRRRAVVADSVEVVEAEVAGKSGLRGMAIKAGFKTVKRIKPGIVAAAVEQLLPAFAPAIDPHYAKARETGDARRYFQQHAEMIADALLAVTDSKASRAKNAVMKKVYSSLRGQAKHHTAAAMPRVADLISRHVA